MDAVSGCTTLEKKGRVQMLTRDTMRYNALQKSRAKILYKDNVLEQREGALPFADKEWSSMERRSKIRQDSDADMSR
jgi:hypothetical protein